MSNIFDDALSHLTPKLASAERAYALQDDIEDILDASQEWSDGNMPWTVAAGIGNIERDPGRGPNVGYGRFTAYWFTPKSDPRRASLYKLICLIDDQMGTRRSAQGTVLTREDLWQYERGWYPPKAA